MPEREVLDDSIDWALWAWDACKIAVLVIVMAVGYAFVSLEPSLVDAKRGAASSSRRRRTSRARSSPRSGLADDVLVSLAGGAVGPGGRGVSLGLQRNPGTVLDEDERLRALRRRHRAVDGAKKGKRKG